MNKTQAIKIVNSDTSSAEELKEARKLLIDSGAMKIEDGKYKIQAKHDPFLGKLFDGEKWMFAGLVSPYDGF